jgi:hypothetical protein
VTIAVLIWIVRVLIVLLVLRLVLRALFPRGIGAPGARTGPRKVERAGGALVRDPQCGTYVPKAKAIAVGSGATARYFCSPACRDTFMKKSA